MLDHRRDQLSRNTQNSDDHRNEIVPGAVGYFERFAVMPFTNCLIAKLTTFIPLLDQEIAGLRELQKKIIHVERGNDLLHQGTSGHIAYIMQSGWGCSYKLVRDGGRQIITFPIAGDLVGIRSVMLRTSDHTFSALTDVVVSELDVTRLKQLFDEYPRLGTAILWATSRDEAITVEHLASIGRRTALERTAHFFLELRDQLQLVGLVGNEDYECPLKQYVLADALGLSAIHVNRVLRELRELKLMTLQNQRVIILDLKGLQQLAGYDTVEAGHGALRA